MQTDTERKAVIFVLQCTVFHNKAGESTFLHLQLLHLCYSTRFVGTTRDGFSGLRTAISELGGKLSDIIKC